MKATAPGASPSTSSLSATPPLKASSPPFHLLPVITLAQLLSTSLWFAVNGVLPDLQRSLGLAESALAWLTSAIQFGFIVGTLCFSLLMIADRFSMRWVFFLCALLGAGFNGAAVLLPGIALAGVPLSTSSINAAHDNSGTAFSVLLILRFATGFCLAGIYPIGMKLASSWYNKGLGAALGFLVGALVVGTALPHLLRGLGANWPWQEVMIVTSGLAILGGVMVLLFAPDGPFLARGARVSPKALAVIIRDPKVRASAFGYFGHMWELYAFLVLTPVVIAAYLNTGISRAVSALSFIVIAAGGLGCVLGGFAARRIGSAKVAALLLASSGLCALLSPWMLQTPWWLFSAWLLFWGTTVSADSPQFSTLTAQNAPRDVVGSVLTFVNCIGFSISILSIQWLTELSLKFSPWPVLPILAVGPILGLLAMRPLLISPSISATTPDSSPRP
jgi:MFS transporter, DHA1 family, inner membrane transport protein